MPRLRFRALDCSSARREDDLVVRSLRNSVHHAGSGAEIDIVSRHWFETVQWRNCGTSPLEHRSFVLDYVPFGNATEDLRAPFTVLDPLSYARHGLYLLQSLPLGVVTMCRGIGRLALDEIQALDVAEGSGVDKESLFAGQTRR